MKRNKTVMRLWVLVALTTITVACSNEDLPIDNPQTTNKATIRAGIAEPQKTRMSATDTGIFGAENLELRWEAGDSFDVYEDGTVKATFTIKRATDISADGKNATFIYDGEGDVPTIENGTAYFGEMNDESLIVPGNQSATQLFDGKKLPMKAENINISADPSEILDITFEHMAYVLKFTFWIPDGQPNPTKVTLTTDNNALLAKKGGTATNSYDFNLTDYSFTEEATYFEVYIPLFESPTAFGTLKVDLNGTSLIGTLPATTANSAFEAGKIYSARVVFSSDNTGSLVQPSEFSNETTATDYSGDGSSSDPYTIASAGNLQQLIEDTQHGNNFSNKHFKLTTDIHVTADTWTPLGTEDYPFWGNFDGNGHSITGTLNLGSTANSGFFGYIYNNTTEIEIKNLTVAANITSTGSSIGGIIGCIRMMATKGATVTIENCHFSGNLTSVSYLGGILGYANIGNGAAPDVACQIKNCTSRGDITSDGTGERDAAGGIAGYTNYFSIITSCINHAKVTGNHPTKGYVGGISGYSRAISDCKNYGEISGIEKIGGIVGAGGPTTAPYTANTNYSEEISGSSYVGAIWGYWLGTDDLTSNTNSSSVPRQGDEGVPYPNP